MGAPLIGSNGAATERRSVHAAESGGVAVRPKLLISSRADLEIK
jgi:hypothetical protein